MGDQSILPTYLLSQVTRRDVTVALGGDGSDELLMGYNAYRPLKAAWQLDRLPMPVRRFTAGVARSAPTRVGSRPIKTLKFARSVDHRPVHRLLAHLGSFKGDARSVLAEDVRRDLPPSVFNGAAHELLRGLGPLSPPDETVAGYLRGYLAEDILVKVDRASMATSLEVRAPFLDPGVIDFALRLPTRLKLRGFTGKQVLRNLMRGRIPDDIIDRPKQGFGVPLNDWLRESLSGLVREQLAPDRLAAGGLFDPAAVTAIVDEHLSGEFDHGLRVWLLLQFQLWRGRWLES
jgi:asparagine synthase (glutamine-hydrolysing)